METYYQNNQEGSRERIKKDSLNTHVFVVKIKFKLVLVIVLRIFIEHTSLGCELVSDCGFSVHLFLKLWDLA